MKKTLCLILLAGFLLLSSTVYAGGHRHHGGGYRGYGGGYYGGHRGYYGGHGGGYYGGHGYYGHGYYGGYGWDGAYYALGIATAVIGTALIVDAINRPCTTYSYAPPPPVYSYGHWEVQRTWIPGTSQRYWVNQYYDSNRNVWVLGHWEERPGGPGYWQETRVWVQ